MERQWAPVSAMEQPVSFCANCGTEHSDSDRFCGECGRALMGERDHPPPAARPSARRSGGNSAFGLPVVVALIVVAVAVFAAAAMTW